MTTRDELIPDRIYYDERSDQYLVTPDGVGIYFYDTRQEAEYQHGTGAVIHIYFEED